MKGLKMPAAAIGVEDGEGVKSGAAIGIEKQAKEFR